MPAVSRAAWVRPGGPRIPSGAVISKYRLETLYWDATDPVLTPAFLDEMRKFCKVGFTRDPNWGNLSAVDLARTMDADLVRLGSDNKQCYVIADIEAMWKRTAQYVVDWLVEWRKLRPTRVTAWTTEPLQGGTVSDVLAARINSDVNLIVVPQLYDLNMVLYPEGAVAMEMAQAQGRRDISRFKIKCYYDAAKLPSDWDGIAFDFARLP